MEAVGTREIHGPTDAGRDRRPASMSKPRACACGGRRAGTAAGIDVPAYFKRGTVSCVWKCSEPWCGSSFCVPNVMKGGNRYEESIRSVGRNRSPDRACDPDPGSGAWRLDDPTVAGCVCRMVPVAHLHTAATGLESGSAPQSGCFLKAPGLCLWWTASGNRCRNRRSGVFQKRNRIMCLEML